MLNRKARDYKTRRQEIALEECNSGLSRLRRFVTFLTFLRQNRQNENFSFPPRPRRPYARHSRATDPPSRCACGAGSAVCALRRHPSLFSTSRTNLTHCVARAHYRAPTACACASLAPLAYLRILRLYAPEHAVLGKTLSLVPSRPSAQERFCFAVSFPRMPTERSRKARISAAQICHPRGAECVA